MNVLKNKLKVLLIIGMTCVFVAGCQDQKPATDPVAASDENESFQSKVILLEESAIDCNTLPKWSATRPPVNQQHIFCGEINSRQRASGFHARPGGIDPFNARVVRLRQAANSIGVYTADVEIRLQEGETWKPKFSSFFPDQLDKQNVIDAIIHAFENSRKQVKWAGESGLGFTIEGYQLNSGKHKGNINTAYPIFVGSQR